MLTKEEMLREVSSYLHTYMKAGRVNVDSFSKKIHQSIHEFEKLFIIRFLAREETKAFIRRLPFLIRSFKTTTTTHKQEVTAEIRGAIDWEGTSRLRAERNFKDKLSFITDESLRSYETQENIVLKHLLVKLYDYLYVNDYVLQFLERDYLNEWKDLRQNIAATLKNNVYLQRVPTVDVNDRMIQNTKKHRMPLYREAAQLIASYRTFMSGQFSENEFQQLLSETFIEPHEEDVLFELYWVIQLIKSQTDEGTLHLMDGRSNLVARWEKDEYSFSIYHDSDGPPELNWSVHANELLEGNNPYTERLHMIHRETVRLSDELFNSSKSNFFWSGRPDILLVKRDKQTESIVSVVIGEVKNSSNIATIRNGLEELITYKHLLKNQGRYNETINISGILCTNNFKFNDTDKNESIKVFTPRNFQKMNIQI